MKKEGRSLSDHNAQPPTHGNATPGLVELANALDTGGMIGYTRALVEDFRKGLEHATSERFEWMQTLRQKKWTGVTCLGMGGSGVGGEFLSALASFQGTVPVHVQRDYALPAWWNPSWLVIATSHSGNTEETLEATETALKAGATVVAISTGGILAGLPELYPKCFLIPSVGGQPPRSAFGHIFSRQLGLLRHLGILPMPVAGADEAMMLHLQTAMDGFDLMEDPDGDIAQLAMCMVERPIAIIGPTELTPVLSRFKNQLNENAARFARIGVVPEMNHNESVAWGGVGDDRDATGIDHVLLILTWSGMHTRVKRRMDWMIAHAATDYAWKIEGEGATLLESMLHLCILTDWISLALSFLHGKNPASIGPISALKAHLDSVE
jgi:glucose/mannose-6-phosphate isomerase